MKEHERADSPGHRVLELEARNLGEGLKREGLTLSTAESCTGGAIGSLVTSIPGSSAYFKGGVIAYSDEAKVKLLGVSPSTLKRNGAVSREVAVEMARGLAPLFETDIGISVTGIAGPAGGTALKPVGTVYICLYFEGRAEVRHFLFSGGREGIRRLTALNALRMAGECFRSSVP